MVDEVVETQLPSTVSSPSLARLFLREALQTWELDGFGAITELLTGELVTNVVEHVDAPMQIRAVRQASSIRVEVSDPNTELPRLEHPSDADEHGRGVFLIDALADSWGTDRHRDGKTVWFELDTSTATAEAHPDD